MLPAAGQRFGPYEILALLGSGGMGVVFRAWDERLHREVAIKLLQDEYRAPGMRERFLLEARAASALAHPHICTIFDIGEQAGEPYLVMELLEGLTLKQTIAQRACSAEEIVRYGEQITEALEAAHKKGIVHRDVKPANVFLQSAPTGESTVKILDFGLAKVSMALRSGRDSRALELTSTGFTVGTLAYMSPEQARGESLDARTDLFSLGVLLYEMATRRTPFRGATTALAFQALLGEPPEPIRRWNVTVPRELERIILRLLQKERSRRYPDAGAVREELARLLARNGGEWLRKLPLAVVPLVPAADPIARRPKMQVSRSRQPTSTVDDSRERQEQATPPPQESVADGVLRPRRLPPQERVPRQAAAEDATRQSRTAISDASKMGAVAAEHKETVPAAAAGLDQAAETTRPTVDDSGVAVARMAAATQPESDSATTRAPLAAPPAEAAPTAPQASAAPRVESARQRAIRDESVPPLPGMTDPSFRRPQRAKSSAKQAVAVAAIEVAEPPPAVTETSSRPAATGVSGRTRWMLVAALLVLCAGVVLLVLELRSGTLGAVVLAPNDTILIGPMANRTGNADLDNVVMEGLRLCVAERSHLHWLGADALVAGTALVSREGKMPDAAVQMQTVARRLGARAYLAGEITGRRGRETIRVDVIDANSNDRLGSVSATANDSRDLVAAIARLADELRAKLGETGDGRRAAHVAPLGIPASGGVAALHAFARGERAWAQCRSLEAAAAYQEAAGRAPQFALAQLRLAALYERAGAELPAADSAGRGLIASGGASDRVQLTARVEAQLLREDDVMTALATVHRAVAQWPQDPEMLTLFAHVLRVSGHMTEALLAAQKALTQDPFRGGAYREASLALIGQDRATEALEMVRRAAEHGVVCDCGEALALALVPPGDTAAKTASAGQRPPDELDAKQQQALVMDDAGRFAEGLTAWRSTASEAQAEPAMISAASGMLAIAASDRALAGRCAEATELAHEASLLAYGRRAAFHIALSGALCPSTGETETRVALARLEEGARSSAFPIAQLLPLIHAAQAVAAHQPQRAVTALAMLSEDRDATPLASYLRGVSLALAGQRAQATAALTQAADHHGYALLTRTIVAPLAAERLHRP